MIMRHTSMTMTRSLVATTTWQLWTATGQLWWRRDAVHPCQTPSEAEAILSSSYSALIQIIQSLAGVSAGLQWHQVSVKMHGLKCLDNFSVSCSSIFDIRSGVAGFRLVDFILMFFVRPHGIPHPSSSARMAFTQCTCTSELLFWPWGPKERVYVKTFFSCSNFMGEFLYRAKKRKNLAQK